MNKLTRTLATFAATGAMLAGTASFAFASQNSHTVRLGGNGSTPVPTQGATSVYITVPNLDASLTPAPTLGFVFTIGTNPGTNPMTETGTLVTGPQASQYPPDTYNVPLPNYGKTYSDVYAATQYTFGSYNYTMSAGPLVDTLPEVGLAAALPAALLGVLYAVRKRRLSASN